MIGRGGALSRACLAGLLVVVALKAVAAPDRIPTPPIPEPPQLGPTPGANLGPGTPVLPPDIAIPDSPSFNPVPIPPQAAITATIKNDPVPPPPSGRVTGPPPTVSPGADDRQVEEVLFIVDPGSAKISAPAETKLQRVAREMAQDQNIRLEVRVFTPAKQRAESTARRLSLARFLAIREILKQNGVPEGRVDGRPLASDPGELNADRAELYLERSDQPKH